MLIIIRARTTHRRRLACSPIRADRAPAQPLPIHLLNGALGLFAFRVGDKAVALGLQGHWIADDFGITKKVKFWRRGLRDSAEWVERFGESLVVDFGREIADENVEML